VMVMMVMMMMVHVGCAGDEIPTSMRCGMLWWMAGCDG